MFTNRSFTEIKAVINGEMVQFIDECLGQDLPYKKVHSLWDATFGANCLIPLRILKII